MHFCPCVWWFGKGCVEFAGPASPEYVETARMSITPALQWCGKKKKKKFANLPTCEAQIYRQDATGMRQKEPGLGKNPNHGDPCDGHTF